MAIYLDNAATSWPKPECVYQAMTEYMRNNGSSPGRGNYKRAMEADKLVYRTRKAICKLLGAERPSNIIFTCNATEAINLALKGFLERGDLVLTSAFEHNAMWRPLKVLERDRRIQIKIIPSSPEGRMDLHALEQELRKGARLVAVAHGSNVLGYISPLDEISALARRYGAATLADASQTAGAYPINVSKWGVDMLAFTGHKALLGPTGTGGLCVSSSIAAHIHPLKEGGTGGMSASPFMPDDPPERFEAGTMNIAGIAGLCASVEFLLETGIDNIRRHESLLMQSLLDELQSLPEVLRYGPAEAAFRVGLLSFNLSGRDPQKVAKALDDHFDIMVRAGLHCAPQAHRLLGTENTGAVRAGISFFNTQDDMLALADALKHLVKG